MQYKVLNNILRKFVKKGICFFFFFKLTEKNNFWVKKSKFVMLLKQLLLHFAINKNHILGVKKYKE